jgi:hypothetical protein
MDAFGGQNIQDAWSGVEETTYGSSEAFAVRQREF